MILGSPEWPQERLWFWRLAFPPVRALVTALVPIALEGREHLPASGPYIVAANHISWKDPPAIEFALGVAIRYMAKSEVFEAPVVGGVLRAIGCFPVRRGEGDRRAIVTALRVLAAGQPLGFFPEGHRSVDGALQQGRAGIGLLALRSGVPVLPVAITGTPDARPRVPPRREIVVCLGAAFRAADLAEAERADEQAVADAVMRRIAALLPARLRGEYSGSAST
ncbi:MAG: lysophospholipid acyltransferase family protein [Candidatus Limnocylindria bacterium]